MLRLDRELEREERELVAEFAKLLNESIPPERASVKASSASGV